MVLRTCTKYLQVYVRHFGEYKGSMVSGTPWLTIELGARSILPDFTPLATQSQFGNSHASFLYFSPYFCTKQRPIPIQPRWVSQSLFLFVCAFLGVLIIKREFVGGCHDWIVWGSSLLSNCTVNQYEDHSPSSKEKIYTMIKLLHWWCPSEVFMFSLVFWCPPWSPPQEANFQARVSPGSEYT